MTTATDIIDDWIGAADHSVESAEAEGERWFGSDTREDALLLERYGSLLARARAGELDRWADDLTGRLALVILLDQFSRNIHRGEPEAFAGDPQALHLARRTLEEGALPALPVCRQLFFLLPFEHSEELADQEISVREFARLSRESGPDWQSTTAGFLDFARLHHDIIRQFGRFPHRNSVLGREMTPAEQAWLASGGTTFGQSG